MNDFITIIGLITAILSLLASVLSYLEAKKAKENTDEIKNHYQIGNNLKTKNVKQASKGNNSPNVLTGGDVTISPENKEKTNDK
ncbi:MAG: hypothetical protein RR557_08055 [Bacilli bacterium]